MLALPPWQWEFFYGFVIHANGKYYTANVCYVYVNEQYASIYTFSHLSLSLSLSYVLRIAETTRDTHFERLWVPVQWFWSKRISDTTWRSPKWTGYEQFWLSSAMFLWRNSSHLSSLPLQCEWRGQTGPDFLQVFSGLDHEDVCRRCRTKRNKYSSQKRRKRCQNLQFVIATMKYGCNIYCSPFDNIK